jgi:hypothetical protein
MRKLFCSCTLILLTMSLWNVRLAIAQDSRPVYDRAFFEPSEKVVTPHIAWAKPLAGGPLKVLFITHRNAMREVIEIAQRLQMQYTVFAAEKPDQFGETGVGIDSWWKAIRGNSEQELTADLMAKLQRDYDVIVIANFQWKLLPIEARYEILKKVKAGTGLAGLIPGRDEYLERLLPTRELQWRWNLWSGAANGVEDWLGQGEFKGELDYDQKHSGESSLRITGIKAVKGSREEPRAGYMQMNIPAEKNARYRFSIWYKTRDLPDGGAILSFYPSGSAALKPSPEWKQFSTVIDSKDQDKLNIYLLNFRVGDVWFDDASLVKEGSDDAQMLQNPGFEMPRAQVPEFLTRAVPFAVLSAWSKFKNADEWAKATMQTATFGRGRLCVLSGIAPPQTQALTPGLPAGALGADTLDYDYYLALPIRTMLWAARREPEIEISAPQSLPTIARETGGKIEFAVSAEKPQNNLTATFVLREREALEDARDHVIANHSEKIPVLNARAVSWQLPRMPAGKYFVDLWIKRGDAVINWASTEVEVTSAQSITDVKLAADSIAVGQPLRGTVTLGGKNAVGATLNLRQYDNFGRLTAQKSLPVKSDAGVLPFTLDAPRPMTVLQRLEARLMVKGETVDVARTAFSFSNFYPPQDDVRFVMWDGMAGNSYIGQVIAREFHRAGIDTQYTSLSQWALRENMWHLPYVTRFIDEKTNTYSADAGRDKNDLIRVPCITDPAYRTKLRQELTDKTKAVARFSTAEYSLGDENAFVHGRYDLCMSPTCLADFRVWAKREYKNDLAALNREYQTQYATWDEVQPSTLEDTRKTGNFAPWVDHRRHMESVWAGLHDYARGVIRETVPAARVGYEGSDSRAGAFTAADYWKLMRAMDLNNIYYRDFQAAAVRDFAAPDTLYGAGWYGGYPNNRNEAFMRWFPWMALMQGTNSFWVWSGYGSAGGVMSFDTSLYPFFEANAQEMREIKNGTGKLLMHAKRQHDGVAILWSPSSVHTREFTPGLPETDDALNSTVRLLDDIGLQPRIVDGSQLGQLNPTTDKTLFLLQAQALSDAEVAAIRKYVQSGGTIIADLRPGLFDEHGKAREVGALDDLFGVRQNSAAPKLQSAAKITAGANNFPALELPPLVADASLQIAGGQAHSVAGSTPILITKQVGSTPGTARGRAILFNASWADYNKREIAANDANQDFAFWPINAPWRDVMRSVLETSAQVRSPVTLSPARPRTQIARFGAGDNEYIGVLQALPRNTNLYGGAGAASAQVPAAAPVTIDFKRNAHVYDVRSGKYLGHAKTISTPLQSGRARLFALLPYRVTALEVAASPARLGADARVKLKVVTSTKKAGRHVLRVRFFAGKKEREEYRQTVVAENGAAAISLPLALNDAPGVWTIIAQDVATGVMGKATMRIAK